MFLMTINPFYIIVCAVVFVTILNIIYITILYPFISKKKIKKKILSTAIQHNADCSIIKSNYDDADFIVKVNGKLFLVKLLYNKRNCDLQINNIYTFIMHTQTLTNNLKSKKISGLSKFMKSKKENRILILNKKAKTIKKVINECEMIMVKDDIDVYGTHILNNDYNYLFKD